MTLHHGDMGGTKSQHDFFRCYRGNVPAVSEEELQAVRMVGLNRLTDVDQPHLQHTSAFL